MHSIQSRPVIGPENVPFEGLCVQFSVENVWVGAMKGLKMLVSNQSRFYCTTEKSFLHSQSQTYTHLSALRSDSLPVVCNGMPRY